MDYKYYLVTGMMRSGTTFVCNLLNSQQNSVCYTDYPIYLFNQSVQLGVEDILKNLDNKEKNVLLSYVKSEGLQKGISGTDLNPGDFSNWLQLYKLSMNALSEGEINIGSKKTNQFRYLDQMMRAGVKIVYMVRDPRDVILSSKNRFSSFDIYNYLGDWERNIQNIQEFSANKNFYLCRFEDLLTEKKESKLAEISEFLGFEIRQQLENLEFRGDTTYTENSAFSDVKKLFDTSALYRWRQDENKDSEIVKYVSEVLATDIKSLGYTQFPGNTSSRGEFMADYQRVKRRRLLQRKINDASRKLLDLWFRKPIFR